MTVKVSGDRFGHRPKRKRGSLAGSDCFYKFEKRCFDISYGFGAKFA